MHSQRRGGNNRLSGFRHLKNISELMSPHASRKENCQTQFAARITKLTGKREYFLPLPPPSATYRHHEQKDFHRHGQRRDHLQKRRRLGKRRRRPHQTPPAPDQCAERTRRRHQAAGSPASSEFLAENNLNWSQVHGVGLAIPGPYERYGVFGKSPKPACELLRLGRSRGITAPRWQNRLAARAAGRGQRRQLRRCGRGADRARQNAGLGDDAHARLRPRLRVRGRGPASRSTATRSPAWKPATCPCR